MRMKKALVAGAMWLSAATTQALAQDSSRQAEKGETPAKTTPAVYDYALNPITVFSELDSYFEQKSSTALKGDVDQSLIPYTTNVFNEQVIEDLKADRLEKVFAYIPGFSRSGTTANSFTIRGQSVDLQNLQVDGLPGLTSRFGSPTTANIERVEVVKGPASVLYGWMDPGGMVNMITKKPEDKEFREITLSGELFPEYGDTSYTGSFDLNGRANADGTLLYRLIAGYEREDSYRDHVKGNTMAYLFPSLSWVPDDKRRLDFQLEYAKDERAADDGLFVLNRDINQRADLTTYYQEPGDIDNDEGLSLILNYRDELAKDTKLNLKWRSVWHTDERKLYESNSVRPDGTLRRRNRHQYNEREYHFGDANLTFDFDALFRQNLIVGMGGGYEYRQYDRLAFGALGANLDQMNPVYTGDVLETIPGSYRNWDLYNFGVYAQDQIFLTDKLSLLVGGRYDTQSGDYNLRYVDSDETAHESVSVNTTAYNAGITYQLTEQAAVYTSLSQSFNMQAVPTFDENNRQLDPESGTQYEVGLKLSLLNGKLNTNFAVFDLVKENVSETVDGASALIGSVESRGAEVTVQYQPSLNWQFQASYAYTDAKVAETTNDEARGNVPGFSPAHTASLLARYNYPEEVLGGLVGMGVGWHYESTRYTDEDESNRVRLAGYHVTDLNFYYELDNLKLSLIVDNLFDETYFFGGSNDVKIYAGDPRKVMVRANYRF
ncbi:TonB-dependent siderophore receptor [Oceanibaculum indicum]|nr:TonB-dependent receptor [Oceanibaculum indicum]